MNYFWDMNNFGYNYPPENAEKIISLANKMIGEYAEYHDIEETTNYSSALWDNYCTNTEAWDIVANGLYDSAVQLMDDEIREQLHIDLSPCSDVEFLIAYMKAHENKYGIQFVV